VQNILKGRKLSASRGGTLILGIIAAVVAAILLVVYIQHVRSSAKSDVAPAPVVVANALIPKGTPGSVIALRHLYTTKAFPKDQIKIGAVTDPGYLTGRVAATDIVPNQQITAADLSSSISNAIETKITGNDRAIALPVAGPQGLVGTVQDGDHVDVYMQLGAVLTLLEPNVLVLKAPVGNTGGSALSTINNSSGQGMILKVNSKQAARLAFADSQGALWFVLRPTVGAKKTAPQKITVQDLFTGTAAG
jgi:Flp pilus assembly protein CpaB